MRALSFLISLCCAFSCEGRLVLEGAQAEASLAPATVEIRGWRGFAAAGTITVTNLGRVPLQVALEATAPFQVQPSAAVAPGQSVAVAIELPAGIEAGAHEGTLEASWEGARRQVPLHAVLDVPPPCASDACVARAFDPVSGRCADRFTDGARCRTTCVREGTCAHGRCLGQSDTCDDGDACTLDACSEGGGCFHEPVRCASADPCQAPVCDSTRGCGTAPVVDGTACGPNDCATAKICLRGLCVARPSPEGSLCSAATACADEGRCAAGRCAAAPRPPPVAWRYTAPVGRLDAAPPQVSFAGHVDSDGNVYFFELRTESTCGTCPTCDCSEAAATRPVDLVSLDARGQPRFRVRVRDHCPACVQGPRLVLNEADRELGYLSRGRLEVRSLDTGALQWAADPTQGLSVHERLADGGAVFSVGELVLAARRGPQPKLGVPAVLETPFAVVVTEGVNTHQATVVGFRSPGVAVTLLEVWGHLYGTGVRPNGEVAAASGACWAPIDRLNVAEPYGGTRASALGLFPLAHERFGTAGRLSGSGVALFSEALPPDAGLAVLPLGGLGPSTLLLTDQLVVAAGAAPLLPSSGTAVIAVDRATVQVRWQTMLPSGVTLEALRDGGTAWQSERELGVLDVDGEEVLRCVLPEESSSPVAIRSGRAYVEVDGGILAFGVGGLDEARTGWTTAEGGVDRGHRAR